jgi:hypothetical protein
LTSPVRFRVRYDCAADLVADSERQFAAGGFLVRVEAPPALELYAPVVLEIATPEDRVELAGQVVQIVAGVGVAVAFGGDDPALAAAVASARAAGGEPAGTAVHAIVPEEAPAGPAETAANPARMIHRARYGNRDERMQIMRGTQRALHAYVLQNPGLKLDEVAAIARMSTVSPDLLKAIADRREWAQRPEVALGLVRNPRTPVPLAIRMLDHVSPGDLRRLAKGSSLRMPVLQAARKKVVGP